MGQYLAVGLSTRITVEKQPLAKCSVDLADVIDQMQADFFFQPAIFDMSEDQNHFSWHLKNEIFKSQLLPFLQSFYPIMYRGEKEAYQAALDVLERESPETWLQVAEQGSYEAFQLDKYSVHDRLHIKNKDFIPKTRILHDSILLSLEGKIVKETFGRQFSFFKFCIQKAFSQFPIAQAARVYITG